MKRDSYVVISAYGGFKSSFCLRVSPNSREKYRVLRVSDQNLRSEYVYLSYQILITFRYTLILNGARRNYRRSQGFGEHGAMTNRRLRKQIRSLVYKNGIRDPCRSAGLFLIRKCDLDSAYLHTLKARAWHERGL
jgi:hypothetical protein